VKPDPEAVVAAATGSTAAGGLASAELALAAADSSSTVETATLAEVAAAVGALKIPGPSRARILRIRNLEMATTYCHQLCRVYKLTVVLHDMLTGAYYS